eukprot:8422-Rhodomonas_salina.1
MSVVASASALHACYYYLAAHAGCCSFRAFAVLHVTDVGVCISRAASMFTLPSAVSFDRTFQPQQTMHLLGVRAPVA